MVEKVSRAYVLGMKIIAANIVIPVILALATNGLIFALGWQQPDRDIQPAFAPPGYVIGIVWTVLFALMGCARGLASRQGDRRTVRLLTILIGLCLAYPFYRADRRVLPVCDRIGLGAYACRRAAIAAAGGVVLLCRGTGAGGLAVESIIPLKYAAAGRINPLHFGGEAGCNGPGMPNRHLLSLLKEDLKCPR
jgi:hypothetical protein